MNIKTHKMGKFGRNQHASSQQRKSILVSSKNSKWTQVLAIRIQKDDKLFQQT